MRASEDRDLSVLATLVRALHDTVRPFDPWLPPADEVIDAYFAYLRQRVSETAGTFLVAEEGGELVGYLCLFARVVAHEPDQSSAPYAYVSDLYVRPDHHRRGIGEALMEAAAAQAREQGATRMELSVLARNQAAIGFYERLGFEARTIIYAKELSS